MYLSIDPFSVLFVLGLIFVPLLIKSMFLGGTNSDAESEAVEQTNAYYRAMGDNAGNEEEASFWYSQMQ